MKELSVINFYNKFTTYTLFKNQHKLDVFSHNFMSGIYPKKLRQLLGNLGQCPIFIPVLAENGR